MPSGQLALAQRPLDLGVGIAMNPPAMNVPKDGEYANWGIDLATRYPLALAEMSRPSAPLGSFEASATARWGIECAAGWRPILVRLLKRLEAAIAA